jgi:hypothetical protein
LSFVSEITLYSLLCDRAGAYQPGSHRFSNWIVKPAHISGEFIRILGMEELANPTLQVVNTIIETLASSLNKLAYEITWIPTFLRYRCQSTRCLIAKKVPLNWDEQAHQSKKSRAVHLSDSLIYQTANIIGRVPVVPKRALKCQEER